MIYLRLFENFNDIDDICRKYDIKNYIINNDVTISVNDNVNFHDMNLDKIPLLFKHVDGYFNCSNNKLVTLEGCPESVGGSFNCSSNKLVTLNGCPKSVGDDFICSSNYLTSLEGSPKLINGSYFCSGNLLKSLEGCPESVGRHFYTRFNKLISLDGSPDTIEGEFDCDKNPIYSIYSIFNNYKEFKDSLDYNYLRGINIIRSRFQEALDELGIEMPEKINGYNYI